MLDAALVQGHIAGGLAGVCIVCCAYMRWSMCVYVLSPFLSTTPPLPIPAPRHTSLGTTSAPSQPLSCLARATCAFTPKQLVIEPHHHQRVLVAGTQHVQVWSITTGWRCAVMDRLPLGGVGDVQTEGRVLQVCCILILYFKEGDVVCMVVVGGMVAWLLL